VTSPAEQLLNLWVEWLRGPGFRRRSAETYRRSLVAFLRDMKVEDFAAVTVSTLDEYVTRMQLDSLAVSTIASRLWALRAFYKWAVGREHLGKDPAKLVRIPVDHGDEPPVTVLELHELAALFAVRQPPPVRGKREPERFWNRRAAIAEGIDERDRALCRLAYDAALRAGEVAALTWADVIDDKRDRQVRLVLPRSKSSRHHSRPMYLGTEASKALRVWKATRSRLGRRGASVFGLQPRGVALAFERCAKLAGIGKKAGRFPTFHILRRSRATHFFEAGATEREARDLLRHRGAESVEKYLRAASESRRRAIALATLPENRRALGRVRRPGALEEERTP
jgi:site-specific recombinase XerD